MLIIIRENGNGRDEVEVTKRKRMALSYQSSFSPPSIHAHFRSYLWSIRLEFHISEHLNFRRGSTSPVIDRVYVCVVKQSKQLVWTNDHEDNDKRTGRMEFRNHKEHVYVHGCVLLPENLLHKYTRVFLFTCALL